MATKLNVPAMTTRLFEYRLEGVFTITDVDALDFLLQLRSASNLECENQPDSHIGKEEDSSRNHKQTDNSTQHSSHTLVTPRLMHWFPCSNEILQVHFNLRHHQLQLGSS